LAEVAGKKVGSYDRVVADGQELLRRSLRVE
jgi:hypothetical protein